MAEPASAIELLPQSWQMIAGAILGVITLVGGAYRYITVLRKPEASSEHIILERAELADMNPLREVIKEFREMRPALERLAHIDLTVVHVDAITTNISFQIKELLDRMDRMEQKAAMAKEVRDEIARTLEQERRQNRRPSGGWARDE